MSVQSMVSPETRQRIRLLAVPFARALGRLGLTPNGLTLIGFGIAVVGGLVAASGAWLAAGVLVIVGGVFDLLDGALARATNTTSRLGSFMDSVFDRWGESVVYAGIVFGALAAPSDLVALAGATAMGSAFMVSYVRAKSESLGVAAGRGMANVGLAPREVRIVILTLGLVLTGVAGTGSAAGTSAVTVLGAELSAPRAGELWLLASLVLITVLATITTIQRILHVKRQLEHLDG